MDISFDDTQKAFAGKNDHELKKSLWLFCLIKHPFLVSFFSSITVFCLRIGIPVSPLIRRFMFFQFCGGENLQECKPAYESLNRSGIGSILDFSMEAQDSEEAFTKTKDEVLNIIRLARNNPAIPYTSLKLTGIFRFPVLEKMNAGTELSPDEKKSLEFSRNLLEEICKSAFENSVPVYFDAEESWIQDAIDRLAEEYMLRYNRDKALVLTTLQMYRHDRIAYLDRLLDMAEKNSVYTGIKLVRGAYWEKENERAAEKGYETPVHQTKKDTDADFDKAIDICLKHISRVVLCAGTHNELSTLYLLRKMKELSLPNNHPHIYFSQLYGMSDHISFNLAAAGYNVTKYLPYGPVKSVIPYLIRRANENTAIAGQMSRELKLISEEVKRRKSQVLISSH